MTPYSQDLRQRILDTVQRGEGSLRQIARRFLVSVSFVTRLLQLHRSTGSLEPRPHGGGNPAVLGPEDLERLRELIRQQPDATLEECRQRLGVSCSTMTISRACASWGCRARRRSPAPQEQDRPDVQEQRREFCEELAGRGPATAGLRGRVRGQHGDDPDSRPCPRGAARLHEHPRPMGVDHADLRAAALRGDGDVGLPGCHQHRRVRDLRGGGAGPGVEARRRGDLGQPQAARVGGGDRGRRGGRGAGGAAAAVEPGPDADRGDVLEGQGVDAVGGGADEGGGLCGVRFGLA